MSSGDATHGSIDRCVACGGPLAHDQRYCLSCGTRRGPLPAGIASVLGELGAGRTPGAPADPPLGESTAAEGDSDAGDGPSRLADLMPLARAAAVSILLMLGVGSVIGAATAQGGVTSLAKTIVVAFHASTPAPTTLLASTGSGGASGGGSGGSGGSGGGGGGTAAPVTVTQRTVTVSQTAPPSSNDGGGAGGGGTSTETSTSASTLPPIGHVWEIVLSDQGYGQSFGTTKGHPYLSKTLADQGELISQYDAVASSPLANEIALVSGQGPTPQTLADCPQYSDIAPARTGKLDQVLGAGCLYPAATQTLGLQMQIAGLKWRAYIQGIGNAGQRKGPKTPSGTATTGTPTTQTTTTGVPTTTPTPTPTPTTTTAVATTTSPASTSTSTSGTTTTATTAAVADTSTAKGCPHPAEGAIDAAQATRANDGYVTWKNPWVYFHSTLDTAGCAADDIGLAALAKNLHRESTTPAFSYIAADPCDDGSDTPCRAGAKGGLKRADAFLKTVVPEIERSPAYKDNGLILITFDQAPQSGPDWSTASCCGQPTYPNLAPLTTTSSTTASSTSTGVTTAPTDTTTTTAPATTAAATTTVAGTTTTAATTTSTTSCPATTTTGTTTSGTTTTAPTSGTTTTAPTTTTTGTTTTTTTTPSCQPAITGDPPGGGQVGLLMISPYIQPDTVNTIETYNHYSLLKSIENLFGLSHLGYAADKQVPAFIPSLFLATKR